MRGRSVVLVGAGAAYLVACALTSFAAGESRSGLTFAGFALMAAAYGLAAVVLLRPRDKGLTVLELMLLLGFGILFRLALFAGSPGKLAGVLGFPAPELPGAIPGPPGVLPQAPLHVALSVWILGVRSESWIGYVFLALCELGTWAVLLMMLEAGRQSSAWLLLYVWNPLAAVAGASGTLSCATGLLLVLALWFLRQGSPRRGIGLLGSSAAGSYALFPALLAVVAGPRRRTAVGLAAVGSALASGALVALLWPAWREAFGHALRHGSQNAGLFALTEWLTGSRLAAWAVAGAVCAAAGVALRREEPLAVSTGMLQAAIVSGPVVLAGGLYVLTPLLVLRPSVVWAGFSCAVLLLRVWLGGGPVPSSWVVAEYGGLVLGLLAEWLVRRRGGGWGEAPSPADAESASRAGLRHRRSSGQATGGAGAARVVPWRGE